MNDAPRDRNAAADESKRAEPNRDRRNGERSSRWIWARKAAAFRCCAGSTVSPRLNWFIVSRIQPADDGNGLRWDIRAICEGVEEGLRICAQLAPEGIAAIGVDGWAVDYVRLGPDGKPIANPFCYRDERTMEAQKRVHARISPERLYELTGVQILSFNTLYQLAADRDSEQSLPWINVPEFRDALARRKARFGIHQCHAHPVAGRGRSGLVRGNF